MHTARLFSNMKRFPNVLVENRESFNFVKGFQLRNCKLGYYLY